MRTKAGIGLLLVTVALAAGVVVSPVASGQTVVHVVFSAQAGGKVVAFDENFDGLRLGDRIAARSPLLDESLSERVGTAFVHCFVHKRIFDPNRGLWNCNYVVSLEDGEIMLQGLDPRGPGVYEMAVIGGTGAYAGANGDATFTDFDDETGSYTDMVIRLGR